MSNFPPKISKFHDQTRGAFSLVEVAMALGLFSFAVMGLLALLPVAVSTHREAKVDTVLTQIKQRLAAEVMLTDGEELAGLHDMARMFDAEGRETTRNGEAVYRAKILISSFTPPGAARPSPSLQRAEFIALFDPLGNLIQSAEPAGSVLVSAAESAAASNP